MQWIISLSGLEVRHGRRFTVYVFREKDLKEYEIQGSALYLTLYALYPGPSAFLREPRPRHINLKHLNLTHTILSTNEGCHDK